MKAYYLIGSGVAILLALIMFCVVGIANCSSKNHEKKDVKGHLHDCMVRYYTDDSDDAPIEYLLVEKGDFVNVKLESTPYKEFAGFYDGKDFMTANQYVDNQGNGVVAITEDIVLYPIFNTDGIERCVVTIEWHDGLTARTNTEYVVKNTALDLTTSHLIKIGYDFKGLYDGENFEGATLYVGENWQGVKTIDKDITLYAKFERKENTCIVTVTNPNDATLIYRYSVKTGEKLDVKKDNLPLVETKKLDKAFSGVWDNYSTEYMNEKGEWIKEITEDITLHVWEKQTIEIIVCYGGYGNYDDVTTLYGLMDGKIDIDISKLRLRTDKEFLGLWTEQNAQGEEYFDFTGKALRVITWNTLWLYPAYR